ncbi:MAG: PEP-CTERM sorting domain-containing protein, partial [Phycisphaerae bacterium]
TIYQDSFTGSATPGTLNGAAPTVGPVGATWTANSSSSYGWSDSGYLNMGSGTESRQNAYLPFTPSSGQIYTLSAGLDLTGVGGVGGGGDTIYWLAIGFITAPSLNTGYDSSGASPWVLSRYNGSGGMVFTGPGTAGGNGLANTPGVNDYSIVLNTGSSAWTYQVYQTNSSVTNLLLTPTPITVATEAITAVGIEDGYGNAQVSNFSLTSSPVPEPATLGLFAIGGAGLLLAARRRITRV